MVMFRLFPILLSFVWPYTPTLGAPKVSVAHAVVEPSVAIALDGNRIAFTISKKSAHDPHPSLAVFHHEGALWIAIKGLYTLPTSKFFPLQGMLAEKNKGGAMIMPSQNPLFPSIQRTSDGWHIVVQEVSSSEGEDPINKGYSLQETRAPSHNLSMQIHHKGDAITANLPDAAVLSFFRKDKPKLYAITTTDTAAGVPVGFRFTQFHAYPTFQGLCIAVYNASLTLKEMQGMVEIAQGGLFSEEAHTVPHGLLIDPFDSPLKGGAFSKGNAHGSLERLRHCYQTLCVSLGENKPDLTTLAELQAWHNMTFPCFEPYLSMVQEIAVWMWGKNPTLAFQSFGKIELLPPIWRGVALIQQGHIKGGLSLLLASLDTLKRYNKPLREAILLHGLKASFMREDIQSERCFVEILSEDYPEGSDNAGSMDAKEKAFALLRAYFTHPTAMDPLHKDLFVEVLAARKYDCVPTVCRYFEVRRKLHDALLVDDAAIATLTTLKRAWDAPLFQWSIAETLVHLYQKKGDYFSALSLYDAITQKEGSIGTQQGSKERAGVVLVHALQAADLPLFKKMALATRFFYYLPTTESTKEILDTFFDAMDQEGCYPALQSILEKITLKQHTVPPALYQAWMLRLAMLYVQDRQFDRAFSLVDALKLPAGEDTYVRATFFFRAGKNRRAYGMLQDCQNLSLEGIALRFHLAVHMRRWEQASKDANYLFDHKKAALTVAQILEMAITFIMVQDYRALQKLKAYYEHEKVQGTIPLKEDQGVKADRALVEALFEEAPFEDTKDLFDVAEALGQAKRLAQKIGASMHE